MVERTARPRDVKAERGSSTPFSPDYRAISPEEWEVIEALASCTMLPGCSDRRFTQRMRKAMQINQAGAWALARLRQRYRRQIPHTVPWLRMPP